MCRVVVLTGRGSTEEFSVTTVEKLKQSFLEASGGGVAGGVAGEGEVHLCAGGGACAVVFGYKRSYAREI